MAQAQEMPRLVCKYTCIPWIAKDFRVQEDSREETWFKDVAAFHALIAIKERKARESGKVRDGVINRAHPDIEYLLHIPYVFSVKLRIKVVDPDCFLFVDNAWRLEWFAFGVVSGGNEAHSGPDLSWDIELV